MSPVRRAQRSGDRAIADLLAKAQKSGTYGQAPSNYTEFIEFLVAHGIESVFVTPDTFLQVKDYVAHAEEAYAEQQKGARKKSSNGLLKPKACPG